MSTVRPRRPTPRRRAAPRWDRAGWEAAEPLLMARCEGRCECCGLPLNGQVERHHRARRRDQGDRLSNLIMLLSAHHRWVTEHPAAARDAGLIVRAEHDPSMIPLAHFGRTWVLLTDDGDVTPTERTDT